MFVAVCKKDSNIYLLSLNIILNINAGLLILYQITLILAGCS